MSKRVVCANLELSGYHLLEPMYHTIVRRSPARQHILRHHAFDV